MLSPILRFFSSLPSARHPESDTPPAVLTDPIAEDHLLLPDAIRQLREKWERERNSDERRRYLLLAEAFRSGRFADLEWKDLGGSYEPVRWGEQYSPREVPHYKGIPLSVHDFMIIKYREARERGIMLPTEGRKFAHGSYGTTGWIGDDGKGWEVFRPPYQ